MGPRALEIHREHPDGAALALVVVVFALLFVDIFNTAGTLIGVGHLVGFVNEKGELPRADAAFGADAIGAMVGAIAGTSTVTSYVESATGVEEGGKTGLSAVIVSVLFLMSLFFMPLVAAVPAIATAPALILVGAMMMRGAGEAEWTEFDEAVPAFLTLAAIPFTQSIADGISLGPVSVVLIKLLRGRGREIQPLARPGRPDSGVISRADPSSRASASRTGQEGRVAARKGLGWHLEISVWD